MMLANNYTEEQKITFFNKLHAACVEHFNNQTNAEEYREDPDSEFEIFEMCMMLLGKNVFKVMDAFVDEMDGDE